MLIRSIADYLEYFEGIRRRTINFAEAIPVDKIDWQPKEDEFTCGETIRHLGSVQLMNTERFAGKQQHYRGHASTLGSSKQEALIYLSDCDDEAGKLLKRLPDESLSVKREDLRGRSISAWRFLMATIEHEVHHRSQLASYLTWMGAEAPQLYGIYMEELPQ
ncbi:MAG: hypothetical protein DWQ07_09695 [Chloroflexi bacterium]|nr:MAG: hypothetical protein DWQ07_09695 [Chloroflexota bacterium]MBL1193013.1 hypothetical protein [Chloroflexota bacterium]NOH10306.1 hypothetical protein [Chloroflexota bacterium]